VTGGAIGWAATGACVVAAVLGALRWLRVAQREHYLPGSTIRFARRWWWASPLALAMAFGALAGAVLSWWWPSSAFATALVVAAGPPGLGLRGRSRPLAWTRRLRTLAGVVAVLGGLAIGLGAWSQVAPLAAAAVAAGVFVVVDAGCALTAPLERALADRHVRRARDRLRRVRPTVVAITGSYGKTSTKGAIAHLLGGSRAVVASPASFNNRAGLARAVNEHLAPGTEVFVAEMGTYGRGEIAELCRWIPPDIAVLTAIGPVHLERFRSEDRIVEAKAEILERARCAVLVVDDERLARLADEAEARGLRVWRCSGVTARSSGPPDADPGAGRRDVTVASGPEGLRVEVHGELLATVCVDARPGNVAAAVAVALELGVARPELVDRLASLPAVAHRLEAVRGSGGALVLDDTYNANPAGTRSALDRLAALAQPGGRVVVVTPGMVELGPRQVAENAAFAAAAMAVVSDLVVVGRTNRRALVGGAVGAGGVRGGVIAPGGGRWRHRESRPGPAGDGSTHRRRGGRPPVVWTAPDRDTAVAWVRAELGPGDVVLYENDLPDHYP